MFIISQLNHSYLLYLLFQIIVSFKKKHLTGKISEIKCHNLLT